MDAAVAVAVSFVVYFVALHRQLVVHLFGSVNSEFVVYI